MTDPDPLQHLFHAARDLPAGTERDAFLEEACGSNRELRRRLDAILSADERASLAFGSSTPGPGGTVLRQLESKIGSGLGVCLDSPGPETSVPAKVTEEARQLRDLPGRYQMLGEIGRGGMGVVFKGRDQDLGRDVAMKVLKREYAERPDVLSRFVEEAQIGGQLQHPGIVPVYELGLQAGERPYFAMKLIQGETLATQLSRRKSVADDRRRLLGVFEQVCQTVAYAHSRRVIHRDLKPANVMIGAFGEVQVVDWGFAKVLPRNVENDHDTTGELEESCPTSHIETVRTGSAPGSGSNSGSKSTPGSMMGTPAYMPPEQARGEHASVDERADVFALGAILCELLTGSPPYTRDEGDVIRQAAMAKLEPARARLASSGADEALIALCNECLTPSRAARPATAHEVADRVSAYLTSVEERARDARIEAAEAKVRAEALKRTQRLGLALIASIALGLAASLTFWRESEAQRRIADARASELEEVTDFQAKQLMAIGVQRMGADIREDVLDAVPPEDRDDMRLALTPINFTDIAAASLESSIFDPTTQAIGERFGDLPLVRAKLLLSVALSLESLGRFRAAVEPARRAVDLRRKLLGPEHPATLDSEVFLGGVLWQSTDLKEAKQVIDDAVETCVRVLAEDHPVTLGALCIQAAVLATLGHTDEAEALIEQLLRHPAALDNLHAGSFVTYSLGRMLHNAGRSEDAERCYRQALEDCRRRGDDRRALMIANNLGLLLMQRGELDEANGFLRESEDGLAAMVGENHILSLQAYGNQGLRLMMAGAYAEAEAHFRRAVDGIQAIFGDDNDNTLIVRGNLGSALFRQGRLDEAEVELRKAFEGFRRLYGKDYDQTVIYGARFSSVQRDRGEHEEAEELARNAAAGADRLWPAGHLWHWRAAEAHSFHGEALTALGRHEEAEPILLDAYEALEKEIPRPRRKRTLTRTAQSLMDLYTATGNAEQAAKWRATLEEL